MSSSSSRSAATAAAAETDERGEVGRAVAPKDGAGGGAPVTVRGTPVAVVGFLVRASVEGDRK